MASSRLPDLSESQRKEALAAVSTLIALGLGNFRVEKLGAALGEAADCSAIWRNIRYGDEGDRRVPVFRAADILQPEPGASVPFGQRLEVAEQKMQGNDLWLKLRSGTFANKWVLAKEGSTWKCACVDDWKGHDGRIPDAAFEGQDFPSAGMYTEGYEGSAGICLVSASGDAFWREVNIEMLFRDIATATVFEKQLGGDANFTDWVAYYAGNVLTFGHVRTATPKQLIVIVKHTSCWRQYLPGMCCGPDVEAVKDDIGKAQAEECQWLHSMKQRWDLKWDEVEFVTAFSFLTTYCAWSAEECWQAAVHKLAALSGGWARTSFKKRAYLLGSAVWCLDEAFDRLPVATKKQLPGQEGDDLRRMVMSLTRKERAEFPLSASDEATRQWVGWHGGTWARIAAECGWKKVLEQRIRHGEDLDLPDSKGWTLAHLAAKEGQAALLTLLRFRGANFGAQDDRGRTPAFVAAECGQLGAWAPWAHGGDEVVDSVGKTAREVRRQLEERLLHLGGGDPGDARAPVTAAEEGDAMVLQALHCKGENLDLEGKSGAAAARAAVSNGHVEALRLLAELGLDLDTQDGSSKSLAHAAAGSGQQEVLRLLADRGADLDLQDADGEAPAHLAAKVGHVGALEVLADSNANLNLKDLLGRVPAHFAAAEGWVESLKLLKDSGANLSLTDKNGEAPVHLAARLGRAEALKLLVDNGPDLRLANKDGDSPVHLAVQAGHTEALQVLVGSGVDLNSTNPLHETPVHMAAANGNAGALKLLADGGAHLSLEDFCGRVPVHLAAREGHAEVLQLLADRHCNLDVRNALYKSTPAHLAARNNHVEALRLLAHQGADLNLRDGGGDTPKEDAAESGSHEALALLSELRADWTTLDGASADGVIPGCIFA